MYDLYKTGVKLRANGSDGTRAPHQTIDSIGCHLHASIPHGRDKAQVYLCWWWQKNIITTKSHRAKIKTAYFGGSPILRRGSSYNLSQHYAAAAVDLAYGLEQAQRLEEG